MYEQNELDSLFEEINQDLTATNDNLIVGEETQESKDSEKAGIVHCLSTNNSTDTYVEPSITFISPKSAVREKRFLGTAHAPQPMNICVCKDNFVGRTCSD
jgi:hypothetical protein